MKLYWKFFSIHLKSEMAYPASFFLSCVGRLLLTVSSLLGIGVMMWRFGSIGDYSAGEVLLGFGVVMTAFNLAECFARLMKAPATIFLIIGILPLVPGSGLYNAMDHLISGDSVMFAQVGLETASYAGAIAVGVSMVSSVARLPFRKHLSKPSHT